MCSPCLTVLPKIQPDESRSITNVVPSSMCMAIHIFQSQSLICSVRDSILRISHQPTIKDLESVPLLVSTYAETLRFGVQIHVPRSAPYHDLDINGVTIPRKSLIIVNTHLAHRDDRVWDTQGGKRPLDKFCADRFLVDPLDPSSGPARQKGLNKVEGNQGGVQFSCDGLQGAWIPFGGKWSCPGLCQENTKLIMIVRRAPNLSRQKSGQTCDAIVDSYSSNRLRHRDSCK